MATRVVVQPYQPVLVAGRAHFGFEVTAEGPLGPQPARVLSFVIERVPVFFTITLLEAYLTVTSAFELRLGTEPEVSAPWDTIATFSPSGGLRHAADVRVTAPCRRLYGRATFSALPVTDVLRVRLAVVDSHL